ncbi:MAG: PTS sugar transporter subunit IIC [Calditrichia bacterium]
MNFALLSALISFLALDTTIAFQTLISSPIFACPLLGWLLGDVYLGFEMGFLFQLLWLGKIPAGATIVPEGNMASMLGTSLIILNSDNNFPNTTLTLVFIESILISYLGALLTVIYRKFNGKILTVTLEQVAKARFRILPYLGGVSVFIYFLMFFFLSLTVLHFSQHLLPGAIALTAALFEPSLVVAKPAILGIGIGIVISLFQESTNSGMEKAG